MSLFIWFLHLTQVWIFILSLNEFVPLFEAVALNSLSIFVGLFPFSLAGIGTRDAAFIFFYKSYLSYEVAAALGALTFLRYLIPGVFGIPFATLLLNKKIYINEK